LAFSSASADEQTSAARLKVPLSANPGEPLSTPRLAADVAQTPGSSVDGSKTGAIQSPGQTPGQLLAPQTQALVQQLESLATQNFSWQGQVWPGQEMRWEIDEDAARRAQEGDETAAKWSTRLHMTLPNLGEINAQIRLQGNQINLVMSAADEETRALMRASSVALRSQLVDAGLTLASMGVDALSECKTDGQTGQ
jgi:flagellar hook-length control protein FliK